MNGDFTGWRTLVQPHKHDKIQCYLRRLPFDANRDAIYKRLREHYQLTERQATAVLNEYAGLS